MCEFALTGVIHEGHFDRAFDANVIRCKREGSALYSAKGFTAGGTDAAVLSACEMTAHEGCCKSNGTLFVLESLGTTSVCSQAFGTTLLQADLSLRYFEP